MSKQEIKQKIEDRIVELRTQERRAKGLDVSDSSLFSTIALPPSDFEWDRVRREIITRQDKGMAAVNQEYARGKGAVTREYQDSLTALNELVKERGRPTYNRTGLR